MTDRAGAREPGSMTLDWGYRPAIAGGEPTRWTTLRSFDLQTLSSMRIGEIAKA